MIRASSSAAPRPRIRRDLGQRGAATGSTRAAEPRKPCVDGLDDGQLADQQAERIVADRGYDGDRLRAQIAAQGAEPVIPGRKNRTGPVEYDKHWYKSRHLVENFFCRISDHRRVATRYEKTARRFLAMVMLSCILVWLKF